MQLKSYQFLCYCIMFFCSCDYRVSWEIRYDESINFDKEEVIKKLQLLNTSEINLQNATKPKGCFFAFEKKCNDCKIISSGDINLHLEKDNILCLDKNNITSFVLYIYGNSTLDAQYSGGVQGMQDHGKIIFVNPKNYTVQYMTNIEGKGSADRVYVKRGQRFVTSNGIGPLTIVNAIKE